jgi:hypothetical protein
MRRHSEHGKGQQSDWVARYHWILISGIATGRLGVQATRQRILASPVVDSEFDDRSGDGDVRGTAIGSLSAIRDLLVALLSPSTIPAVDIAQVSADQAIVGRHRTIPFQNGRR